MQLRISLSRSALLFLSGCTDRIATQRSPLQTLRHRARTLLLARAAQNVELFSRMGRNTLYLCGTESIANALWASVLGIFGLTLDLRTPLTGIVYVFVLLYVTDRYLVPLEKRGICAIEKEMQRLAAAKPWKRMKSQ